MFPEEVRGQPVEISKSGVCGDLQHCLLTFGMFMEEGVANVGSRSAVCILQRGKPSRQLGCEHRPSSWTYFIKCKQSHQVMACCLIFKYSASNRMIHFAGNSPTLHEVLMQLLNWKTHSLCLMSHTRWSLGAAECPKLILNLLGIEGAQQPQRLCQDDIRRIYFGGVTAWQNSMIAFWLSLPALHSPMTAVMKPTSKQMTSCDITCLKTFMHVTLKHCIFFKDDEHFLPVWTGAFCTERSPCKSSPCV